MFLRLSRPFPRLPASSMSRSVLFFEEEEVDCKYEVVRKADRREVSRVISVAGTGHGYTYEALSFRKRNKKMEPFVVTVSQRPDEETLYNHDGEEFLLILKGQAEVTPRR